MRYTKAYEQKTVIGHKQLTFRIKEGDRGNVIKPYTNNTDELNIKQLLTL